jgi:hypothetical protein
MGNSDEGKLTADKCGTTGEICDDTTGGVEASHENKQHLRYTQVLRQCPSCLFSDRKRGAQNHGYFYPMQDNI